MYNYDLNHNFHYIYGIYRILSTSHRSPIHLWNALNGQLEATYRVYDQYVLFFRHIKIIKIYITRNLKNLLYRLYNLMKYLLGQSGT